MGRTGYCMTGDHGKCPDTAEDTGTCSCPCHLKQNSNEHGDIEIQRLLNSIVQLDRLTFADAIEDRDPWWAARLKGAADA
jgi:hypothetical protein